MKRTRLAAALALTALAALGCGKEPPSGDGGSAGGTPASKAELSPTTPAPTGDAGPITWATYREVGTLDPIQAFDYPENTVITAMCESLFRQQPDGTVEPGLAVETERPDDTTLVLTLADDATFWDGEPVTPEDVIYSLERHSDTALGGFYGTVFQKVSSITASGPDEVTIKLSEPDFWLEGELAGMPGIVVEKAYAEDKGKTFGTPSGGTMCTGALKLGDWKPGSGLTVERHDGYWDPAGKAKIAAITFKGVPDDASMTSGLLTGAIDGVYPQALSTMEQIEQSPDLQVYEGPAFMSDALVISSLKGALGDVRVRRALSMALDRRAYINTLWKGHATMPRTLANPGTWGYGKDVFQANWDGLADPELDVAKAKQLVGDAGATGKTVTIGTTAEVDQVNTEANAFRAAGESIGLKVRFKSVSAQNYINFFTDAQAREGVDGFPTTNYPDYADPAALYNTIVMPDGSQNYAGFDDPETTDLLNRARRTADPDARAELVAQVGDRINDQLPWIPVVLPSTVLIMNEKITGAPSSFMYMGGPWAAMLGGS